MSRRDLLYRGALVLDSVALPSTEHRKDSKTAKKANEYRGSIRFPLLPPPPRK